jgi:hypothetical protein
MISDIANGSFRVGDLLPFLLAFGIWIMVRTVFMKFGALVKEENYTLIRTTKAMTVVLELRKQVDSSFEDEQSLVLQWLHMAQHRSEHFHE